MAFFVKDYVFKNALQRLVNDFGWDPKDPTLNELYSLIETPLISTGFYFTRINKIDERSHWIISSPKNNKGDSKTVHIYNNDVLIACFGFISAFENANRCAYAFSGRTILKALNHIKGTKMLPYSVWKMFNSSLEDEFYYIYCSEEDCLTECTYTYFNINKGFVRRIKIPSEFLNILLGNRDSDIEISEEQETTTYNISNKNLKKENDTTMKMPTIMKNFDFGPVNSGVQMSPVGPAIQRGAQWLSYNPSTEQTVDVTGITFDLPGMIFKMPVAIATIQKGDIIVHQNKPMFVTGIVGTKVEVVDIMESEEKIIIPVTNIFGFNFITKITPLMNFNEMAPSPEQPFGNIMPFIAMSMLFNNDNKNDSNESMLCGMNMEKMFMMFALSSMLNPNNNNNPFAQMFNFGATITPKTSMVNPKNTSNKEDNT